MNFTDIIINWVKSHPVTTAVWTIVFVIVAWFVIRHGSRIRDFLGETKVELGKCIWPVDPQEKGYARYQGLVQSTLVVVVASLLLSLYIAFADTVMSAFIKKFILKIGD
ncbi:preprotein translocase subunit SecE [Kamptonema cortianum]|nr:preprotein translocase subunit SecE [Kamptonema cortianum]MDL5050068.1 preprotein translocase subunit SecE [Oscillatoria amoena NRMC-F 0135]